MFQRSYKRLFSLRWKLSLLSLFTFGVSIALLCGWLYRAISKHQVEAFDSALHNFSIDVMQSLEVDFFGNVISTNFFAGAEKILPFSLGDTIVQLRDGSGRSVARSGSLGGAELPLLSSDIQTAGTTSSIRTIVLRRDKTSPQEYRLSTVFIDRPGIRDFFLQVAAPMRSLNASLQKLALVFFLAIPFILLLGFAVSWFLSGRAIKPIRVITKAARKMQASQLSLRLPLPAVRDETYELTATLNDLLDRLEKAFLSQDHFIAHVSHQLRTPLAVAQGELELLLGKTTDPAARESLQVSISELKYLGRLVGHLLLLAKIEAGAGTLEKSSVRLDEAILDVLGRLERRAEARGIKLRCNFLASGGHECFEFLGDADLLKSMIENLVDNAIKYSPPQTTVEVALWESDAAHVIRVKDQGEGIRAEERENIFRRFYRTKEQTTGKRTSGHGLGLVVAQEIAQIHGGKISLSSDSVSGSEFTIELPKPLRTQSGLRKDLIPDLNAATHTA